MQSMNFEDCIEDDESSGDEDSQVEEENHDEVNQKMKKMQIYNPKIIKEEIQITSKSSLNNLIDKES